MKSPLRRIFVCKRESAYPPRCGLGFNFEELGLDAGFVLLLWEWGLTVDGIYSDITDNSHLKNFSDYHLWCIQISKRVNVGTNDQG